MIRWADAADYDALGRVMHDAIHHGPSPYSQAQKMAWLPAPNGGAGWAARLASQRVAVAEANDLLGFMSLGAGGYVDLAYILPAARGRGVFRALFEKIEADARAQGAAQLWTHASLMAQGAFGAVGFDLIQHETVERAGQSLARAEMRKNLA